MTLRAELVVASLLSSAGVRYSFRRGAGPDLLVEPGSLRFGIEISSRKPRSLHYLSTVLRNALRQRGRHDALDISTDPIPPVAIGSDVIEHVVQQFVPADGGPGVRSLRVMAARGWPEEGIPPSWVTIRTGNGILSTKAPYNSPHMVKLAKYVARDVMRQERKVRQSQEVPTVLIVDVTNTDLPDLRSWPDAFGPCWRRADDYLAVGAMVCSEIKRIPTIRFSLNPYADQATLSTVAATLGACPEMADFLPQPTQVPLSRRVRRPSE